jgi:hypothetical protein
VSTQLVMRGVRNAGALLAIIGSGWLLLAIVGLITTVRDHAAGWRIYELPRYPLAVGIGYGLGALALPLVAAWLMLPPRKDQVLRSYLGRAVVSLAGATFVAFVLFLIVLWNI